MGRYMQFRLFIGPEYLPSTDPANFPYYAFGNMPAVDADIDLDYSTQVATTLASGAVTLVTTNSAPLYDRFPLQGGLWLAPGGAGQGWEHVTYFGRSGASFPNLGRESASYREHNGVHNAGATVYFWYPVQTDAGVLSFNEQLTPDFSARYWSFEVRGFVLPPTLLRNDYMVAVCYRQAASGAWKYHSLGISDSVRIRDDFERKGEWTLHVDSIHGRCENTMIHGVHIGDLDVARNGQAQSSAPLGSAFKDLKSGDFKAAQPDFSADSVVDGDPDTLFISDYMVGTNTALADYYGPTQLYINPHLGRGPAYKWVELLNFSTSAANLRVYDPATGLDYVLDFSDVTVEEGDYWVILTDDPVTFARENPATALMDRTVVKDLSGLSLGSEFLRHCNPSGGAMCIDELTGKTHVFIWGSVTDSFISDRWDLSSGQWRGPSFPAPGYGQTIAYRHYYTLGPTEDSGNQWALRDYGTPGYMPRPDRAEYCWLAIYLPGLGLVLRDDISPGATTIYLVDASGEPSTEGLPNAGVVQIGAEQIAYTGKQSDRLTGCTVGVAHLSGDIIAVVENGIATDGYPITKFLLRRFHGTTYLQEFYIRFSRTLARLPEQGNHEEDYLAPFGVSHLVTTGSTADYLLVLDAVGDAVVRCRTVLIEFRRMTVDPSFARLNELQALVDTSLFNSEYYVPAPANAGAALMKFFTLAGIPPGACTYAGVTLQLQYSFRSAREWAWRALTDFADMNGLFVSIARDARVVISNNTFYSTSVGAHTATYTWDEDDVVYVDKVTRAWEGIGQVRLAWKSPDGASEGTALYPASVSARGGIEDIGPFTYADAAAAELSARKRYFLKRVPFYVVAELVDINLAVRAGQTFRLNWLFPGENVAINRLYMIAAVDLRFVNETAVMVVTGLQIDREADW